MENKEDLVFLIGYICMLAMYSQTIIIHKLNTEHAVKNIKTKSCKNNIKINTALNVIFIENKQHYYNSIQDL